MVIGISHRDKATLRANQKIKKVGNRKNRTVLLSDKTRDRAMQSFEETATPESKSSDVQIDEHVKMNDNYMRTGKYIPKKK